MSVLDKLISMYAPHTCVGCGHEGAVLCVECCASLPLPVACCYRCGTASKHGRTCSSCRAESSLISVNTVTQYDGYAKDLLWRLKFDRVQAAADIIGQGLAALYKDSIALDVLIVPAPTASSRVRQRGYDQATLIAKSVAKHTGCKYTSLLSRQGTQEQIGATRQQRHDQLHGAFRVAKPALAKGARILLVDDVVTTGATLEEAATVLKTAGATAVGALAFARV